MQQGHDVRLLAPYDPTIAGHVFFTGGARPGPRPLPDYVIPLSRTSGFR